MGRERAPTGTIRTRGRGSSTLDVYAYWAHTWVMTATIKPARLAVRLTTEQDALIRHAADVEGKTITDFTVDSAVTHAENVLADRRMFPLSPAGWAEFVAVLDRPVTQKPRLAKVLAESLIFDGE
jgi:uncharacterized protein (DUF1778 family)